MSTDQDAGYDVVVVGGGPCGSTVSTLVAMQGHRVLLLEQEGFPRYQIGESLLPSTVHGVCRLLGVSDELAAAGFTVKRGGSLAGAGDRGYSVGRSCMIHLLPSGSAKNAIELHGWSL
jgi:flavin-dependent dehydrogenase